MKWRQSEIFHRNNDTVSGYSSDEYLPMEKERKFQAFHQMNVKDSLLFLFYIVSATLLGYIFDSLHLDHSNIMMIYILCAMLISIHLESLIYSLLGSIITVFIFNFCFTIPRYSFQAVERQYPLNFIIMAFACMIASFFTRYLKRKAKLYSIQGNFTKALLSVNQNLQKAQDLSEILEESAKQLMTLLKSSILFERLEHGKQTAQSFFPFQSLHYSTSNLKELCLSKKEQAVVQWVSENQTMAGRGTGTLDGVRGLYVPIHISGEVTYVLGIFPADLSTPYFTKNNLLWGIINEIQAAIEKDSLLEEAAKTKLLAEKEHLRANLLRSISHDLRTPLTGITGNADILLQSDSLDSRRKADLVKDIQENSRWLTNVLENLLSITRLDQEELLIHREIELLEDLVYEAVQHVPDDEERIEVSPKEELIFVKVEGKLIVQVIVNLLTNALKYSPSSKKVLVSMREEDGRAIVEVADQGEGVTKEEKKEVFKMYYTSNKVPSDGHKGTGLGLALCQSIIHAHQGEIYVKDRIGGGSIFGFSLETISPND